MRPFRRTGGRAWRMMVDLFDRDDEAGDHLWLVPYLVLSLILHLIAVIVLPSLARVHVRQEEAAIEIIPLKEFRGEYQIADIAKPLVEERPKHSKLLGRYDSTAKEETVSTIQRSKGERKRERAPREQGPLKDRLYDIDKKLFVKSEPELSDEGEKNGGSKALDDFFPDYRHGDQTYLNVLRYPDVEYFVRLKRAFKITFNPVPALREAFVRNQVVRGSVEVVMAVSVDRNGTLDELFVLRSSGIPGYDQEAMRTVRASAPFSSPPEKLLTSDGKLRMSWTFTVYL